jgi:predicted DNA-binding protein YlxM (UPF0122 family)
MNVAVERTEKEILNYFEHINLASKSQAKQEQIDALAKEVNQSWWVKNKERFAGKSKSE